MRRASHLVSSREGASHPFLVVGAVALLWATGVGSETFQIVRTHHHDPGSIPWVASLSTRVSAPWTHEDYRARGDTCVSEHDLQAKSMYLAEEAGETRDCPIGPVVHPQAMPSETPASACVFPFCGAPNSVIATIPVGISPSALAYDSANGYVYVTNENSGNVSAIDGATNSVVGSIPVGAWSSPSAVAYDDENGYVYVGGSHSIIINGTEHTFDNVTVINGTTGSIVGSIFVGSNGYPIAMAYDHANGYVYVVGIGANNVTVIDGITGTVVGSVKVGSTPWYLACDSTNGYLYVADGGANSVSVINGTTDAVVGSVRVGFSPRGVAYDNANGYVYIANYGSHNVTVINGTTGAVVDSVQAGSSPWDLAYDNANGYVYVTNFASDNVTVIDGTTDTVIGPVQVGYGPEALVYDPANGYVYVGNVYTDTVSVISPRGLVPPTNGPMFLSLPLVEGYALATGAAVLVIMAAVLLATRRRK